MIRVIINGVQGKMGQIANLAIENSDDIACVAGIGRKDNLADTIQHTPCDVVVDFTQASVGMEHCKTILEQGVRPVIGTSGFQAEDIQVLSALCEKNNIGGIIAPNFSIGACLMMRFSAIAAQYFNAVEIIESHHHHKYDAPSGTAIKTAELIAENNPDLRSQPDANELMTGARGANCHQVNIHSVRLPALLAHQEVVLSGMHETLTLKHDSYDRKCFMSGILLAIREVMHCTSLIYGLEKLLTRH